MAEFVDYYALLQVHPLADSPVIEKAYRVLIAGYHPDAGGDTVSAQMLNQARDTLLNPEERSRYDLEWRANVGSAFLGHGASPEPSVVIVETTVVVDRSARQDVTFDKQGRQVEWDACSMKMLHIDQDGSVFDDAGRRLRWHEPNARYMRTDAETSMGGLVGDFGKAAVGKFWSFGKVVAKEYTGRLDGDPEVWEFDYWQCSCKKRLPNSARACGFCGDRRR